MRKVTVPEAGVSTLFGAYDKPLKEPTLEEERASLERMLTLASVLIGAVALAYMVVVAMVRARIESRLFGEDASSLDEEYE